MKRFVTRQYWLNYQCRVWNVWDKVECRWMTARGYFGREDALKVADQLNKKEE